MNYSLNPSSNNLKVLFIKHYNMVPVPKKISVILFYDKKGNILIQDRKQRSKWGEEYGFFGGAAEEGETPEETLKRELMEELELSLNRPELFKRYEHRSTETGVVIERNVYLSNMPNISKLNCHEGKIFVTTFEEGFNLKLIPGFADLLREIYIYLKSQGRII